MRTIVIDCLTVASEADFWSAYVESVELDGSGYFGRNLDAFSDALNGGPGWPGECALQFINAGHLQAFRSGYFLEALRDIAGRSTTVKVSFD